MKVTIANPTADSSCIQIWLLYGFGIERVRGLDNTDKSTKSSADQTKVSGTKLKFLINFAVKFCQKP